MCFRHIGSHQNVDRFESFSLDYLAIVYKKEQGNENEIKKDRA